MLTTHGIHNIPDLRRAVDAVRDALRAAQSAVTACDRDLQEAAKIAKAARQSLDETPGSDPWQVVTCERVTGLLGAANDIQPRVDAVRAAMAELYRILPGGK